jgi:hypothetical protein
MTKFSNLVIIYLLVYEDGTECSETSAYKIQTPGNYPEENILQRKVTLKMAVVQAEIRTGLWENQTKSKGFR